MTTSVASFILAGSDAANVWTALPSILWLGFAITLLACVWRQLRDMLDYLVVRVREGAAVKIGSVELGELRIEQQHVPAPVLSSESMVQSEAFAPGGTISPVAMELSFDRQRYYNDSRRIVLVHRLFRSSKPDQIYDVLIYLIPHGDGTLIAVKEVEYFFGRYWKNQVFQSADRSRGFPVLTSAYGTFLCAARVTFNDGSMTTLYRYIDFEMGASAPKLEGGDRKG